MLVALTRAVSPALERCELTHLPRQPIDPARAQAQHEAYEGVLRSLGVEVVRVPAAPELPDAVFIEDTAVVLDEVAVIARPGASSRQEETGPVARVLAGYRPLLHLASPATLDGGDVIPVGRTLYVGLSSRTNRAALEQLASGLESFGYTVVPVEVTGCLHLKSAVTLIGDRLLLINPDWARPSDFGETEMVRVDREEPGGANALLVGETVVYPTDLPRTAERLRKRGLHLALVENTELAKAEGGVTCCSILLRSDLA